LEIPKSCAFYYSKRNNLIKELWSFLKDSYMLAPQNTSLTCFKAYDIRGKVPEEFNETIAYRIGRAYGQYLNPKQGVIKSVGRANNWFLKHIILETIRITGLKITCCNH